MCSGLMPVSSARSSTIAAATSAGLAPSTSVTSRSVERRTSPIAKACATSVRAEPLGPSARSRYRSAPAAHPHSETSSGAPIGGATSDDAAIAGGPVLRADQAYRRGALSPPCDGRSRAQRPRRRLPSRRRRSGSCSWSQRRGTRAVRRRRRAPAHLARTTRGAGRASDSPPSSALYTTNPTPRSARSTPSRRAQSGARASGEAARSSGAQLTGSRKRCGESALACARPMGVVNLAD